MLEQYEGTAPVNIGSGAEIAIADLATQMAQIVGYNGTLAFDPSQPDGTPRKVLDSAAIRAMGWQPHIKLAQGLRETYEWFCQNVQDGRHAA